MNSDYFAVLGQPRRPWLDLHQLKHEYQRLTFARHPDRTDASSDATDFSDITEAYRVLSNPKLRLQHLLSLEAPAPQTSERSAEMADLMEVPAEMADLFMDTASLVKGIDELMQRREAATSALARSMLQGEIVAVQKRAGSVFNDLGIRYSAAMRELQELDESWISDPAGTAPKLGKLGQRFCYLLRWMEQLREKQFQLSTE